jgi:hypothetical protein
VLSDGILEQSMGARNRPSRNKVVVPARQATSAGGIDSSIRGSLKVYKFGTCLHSILLLIKGRE